MALGNQRPTGQGVTVLAKPTCLCLRARECTGKVGFQPRFFSNSPQPSFCHVLVSFLHVLGFHV